MTLVQGELRLVTDTPAEVSQVWIQAPKERLHGTGMVTDGRASEQVTNGVVSFNALPGAAVMVLLVNGIPSLTVKLLIPDKANATLRECIEAVELADDGTISALEELALEVARIAAQIASADQLETWASETASAAAQAQTSKDEANDAANRAGVHESNTRQSEVNARQSELNARHYEASAKQSDTNAQSAAGRASSVADSIRGEVQEFVDSASESAVSAADSATEAKTSETNSKTHEDNALTYAERAEFAAEETIQQVEGDFATRNYVDTATENTSILGYVANAGRLASLDDQGKIRVVTSQVSRENDATSKGYVDAQNSYRSPIRLTSGTIDELRGADDAHEYIVASAAAAKVITGWPTETPGYLINRTAAIPTQTVIAYTSNGPRIFWREWRPGSDSWSEWEEQGKSEQQQEASLEHDIRADQALKRHGYILPTNGRGVVMLRFDDYPQDFIIKVLPLLRQYDLPAYWACTIRHVEQEQPTEWGTVQDWFLKDGIRIWNHSKTHSNSTRPEDILDNIVGAADYFESKMPHVAIDGWVAPGTGASTPYNDFISSQSASYWGTYAGRLIMQRHGIVNGGVGGYMQPMGANAVAQSHYTFEKSTVAQFKQQVQIAQAGTYALSMMAHPQNLGASGYMSLADFESCLAWLAAERDAGRLMVLTGDVAPVLSPGGGTRNDLAPNFPTGSLATNKTYFIDTAPTYWAGGGTREFEVTVTADAESVVRLEVTGTPAKAKQFTIPAGVSTVRTFFGMPKGFTTVGLTVRRVSGGTATLNAAHLYAA